MKIIAYLRISTAHQEAESQKYAILTHYPVDLKSGPEPEFITEQVSGKVSWKDRKLGKLVKTLNEGDVLLVSELSRLGRSFYEVIGLLAVLSEKKIRLHSVKENFDLADNIQSKVVAFAFSIAAELERQLISERTKEALAMKKSQGVTLGRPKDRKDSEPRPPRSAKNRKLWLEDRELWLEEKRKTELSPKTERQPRKKPKEETTQPKSKASI